MPKNKIKTKKAAAKRFKITGTGKIVHKRAGKIHFGRRKRGNRRRALSIKNTLGPADSKRVRLALGKKK